MLHRTEGIIIKSSPYSDADLIVTLFTLNYGLIKVFSKSPLKMKSRFGSALEPFSYNRIAFWGKENKDLPRLTQADLIHSFQTLRESMGCFLRVSEMIEITLNLLPEREPQRELFHLLLDTMGKLEHECLSGRRYLFYKVKLLTISGLSPYFDGCARCGKGAEHFYLHEGSIICGHCIQNYSDDRLCLSRGAINLYERIRKWEWDKLERIHPSRSLIDELDNIINLHIQYRTDKEIRTREFMKKWSSGESWGHERR